MKSDSDINVEFVIVSRLATNGMEEIRLIAFFFAFILYMLHLHLLTLGEFVEKNAPRWVYDIIQWSFIWRRKENIFLMLSEIKKNPCFLVIQIRFAKINVSWEYPIRNSRAIGVRWVDTTCDILRLCNKFLNNIFKYSLSFLQILEKKNLISKYHVTKIMNSSHQWENLFWWFVSVGVTCRYLFTRIFKHCLGSYLNKLNHWSFLFLSLCLFAVV